MKVFFYSIKDFERPYLEAANVNRYDTLMVKDTLSLATASKAKGFDAVCIFTGDDASAPVIEELYKYGIRQISIRATGYDNVAIDKAIELGIKVSNVPDYSPYAVAEHTVAMMLALNRKLVLSDRQVHAGNFSLDKLVGFDLHGKIAGIIGTGRIGSAVAKILHGFGCQLLAYDISRNKELEMRYNINYVTLDLLCSASDIITLHVPLNESTRHLISRQLLHQMKEGVMLINTARGQVVNTTEVLEYIENGRIGFFGMDVYEKERGLFFYDHSGDPPADKMLARLLAMPNVLVTPHQAFATKEALTNIATATYYNIDCQANNTACRNELPQKMIVTEEVYEEEEEL